MELPNASVQLDNISDCILELGNWVVFGEKRSKEEVSDIFQGTPLFWHYLWVEVLYSCPVLLYSVHILPRQSSSSSSGSWSISSFRIGVLRGNASSTVCVHGFSCTLLYFFLFFPFSLIFPFPLQCSLCLSTLSFFTLSRWWWIELSGKQMKNEKRVTHWLVYWRLLLCLRFQLND